MITEYENNAENAAIAEATPQPRHVWYDGPTIRVYTGSDCPQDDRPNAISQQVFRDRMTPEETNAILARAASGDLNIAKAMWLMQTQHDGMLYLDDPRVTGMLAYLVSVGLLAADRPAQLLAVS